MIEIDKAFVEASAKEDGARVIPWKLQGIPEDVKRIALLQLLDGSGIAIREDADFATSGVQAFYRVSKAQV